MWNLTVMAKATKNSQKKDQICGWREMEKGGQHAQTSSYKIKYHRCNVQHDYR